jgi:hypothetical protein
MQSVETPQMTPMSDDEQAYARAKKRVEEIKGFYVHLGIYLIVNTMLFLINVLSDSGNYWFYWPLLGWGIGLAAHAFTVFAMGGLFGTNWEERQIRKLLEEERRGQ